VSAAANDESGWPVGKAFRLATRGSPLALRQTRLVASAMRAVHPGLRVEEIVVRTRGDEMVDAPLDRIGGQGVFVTEVQAAVIDGRADGAVHSAKDLRSESRDELVIAAVPERGDARDALVGGRLTELRAGSTIATGSARRRAQLANFRPDLTFVDLRGNMARRVSRADDDDVQAVVVAKVALDRLGWTDRIDEILDPSVMLPQAGQGAIAVECRTEDVACRKLLARIDHWPSHRALDAERALLRAMGGSCQTPIAAWAEAVGDQPGLLRLHALTASLDGRIVVRADQSGGDPEALGAQLGQRLISESGASATAEATAGPA
jgi:hydroxymethylbilane synthase